MRKGSGEAKPADDDPAAVVRDFIAAMHAWELSAAAAMDEAKRAGENGFLEKYGIQAGQDAVFAQFCTPKARPYGRRGSFSRPPEYQPDQETILGVAIESSRRAVVETQRNTGFQSRRRYVLLRQGGRWRLDSVKWRQVDGDWRNGAL
ncbi:MAG: hypothetical protein CFK52_08000 [Chloracidobacterium sp. CP2_5A]|nr:MAG: hypothetical protein CFK52_08000 [Chloracidobacterium sp. CP2_5A]